MEVKAVIWDWDGTLVDSFSACFKTTKKIFSLFEKNITEEEYVKNFYPNWYKMYENFGIEKELWEVIDSLWYKHFDYSEVKWREGAEENLRLIKDLGIKQGVVTASTRRDINEESKYLRPERYIDKFICFEDAEKKKPDPEPLFKILEIFKVKPEECIYIGDTAGDIIMGKKAGIKYVLAIISPFSKIDDLERENPHYIFKDLKELLNFWRNILSKI
ncbi:MAG: phosphatase [Dictyoglomus sp. NZ13-RE01]|nr:MAG: phosphatase [Dictyoglomus sp. NZ13-RE01]